MKTKTIKTGIIATVLTLTMVGCSTAQSAVVEVAAETSAIRTEVATTIDNEVIETTTSDVVTVTPMMVLEGSALETADMFTARDIENEVDLSEAVTLNMVSNENVKIELEGVYVLSGDVSDVTIIVAAEDEAKVQLILDGVKITNEDVPAIVVQSADKVFVTTTNSENTLEVTGEFKADGDTNLDAVIYSKSDLVLNGTGTLVVNAPTGNGISSKDDLKITGGVYTITSLADAIEANDSIRIYDGDITIVSNKDGLHSENDEDLSLGYIYIQNATLTLNVADDAIRGNSVVQIDGGDINIETCAEGIEGTYIQINDGTIDIYATDDGINAAEKSTLDVMIEVNGGVINVVMASGDTDGFDANGNIIINGGTISVEGMSTFDANGTTQLNGGEVTVNGAVVTEITQSQMGGKQRGEKR